MTPLEGPASGSEARLRVLPIPQTAPPLLDPDEVLAVTHPTPYVQDALAVDFRSPGDSFFDRQRTPKRDLPDPERFVRQMAQAMVEVMAGIRPAPQLIRWTSPEVYAVLARRSLVAARRSVASARPPVVRRVRVCEPADGVAEACAVVLHQDRVRALALRLTGLDGRWVVTELGVG